MVKWSYSSLKDYVNCARQYKEVKVTRNYTKKDTVSTLYGKEVHRAFEEYARNGTPLPKHYQRYKPIVDALLAIPGERYIEHKMALTHERTPCAFDAEDYWVRGIVDLMVIDDDTAFIVDYKTGNAKYPDVKQLKLMALMAFAHFPQVKHVKAGLLFVVHEAFFPEEYKHDWTDALWGVFHHDLERLKLSFERDHWPANPTGLCKFCPVHTCEYHKS